MLNSENKIDGLFRGKLQSLEVEPPATVWKNISGSLDAKKRKRRIIFVWGLSSAASLLFAFLAGWYLSLQHTTSATALNSENPSHQIQQTEVAVPDKSSTYSPALPLHNGPENIKLYSPVVVSEKNLTSVNTAQQELSHDIEPTRSTFFVRLLSPVKPIVRNSQDTNYELIAINADGLSETDKAIIAQNIENKQHKEETAKAGNTAAGFSVGVQASPVFRFVDNSPAISEDASPLGVSATQKYTSNIAGGVVVTYKTNERFSIQSGINYDEIAQNGGYVGVSFAGHNWINQTADNLFAANPTIEPGRNTSNNVFFQTNMGLTNIEMPAGAELALANSSNKLLNEGTRNYNLKQHAGYLEIPFIVRYKIIDQNIGLHVLGGINTNVLMSNAASLVDNQEVVAQGKIEGLNPLTFSSSIGLGMNYAITEKFNLSVEPTMKVQLNSLNKQSYIENKPYSVGIYTGLTYNF